MRKAIQWQLREACYLEHTYEDSGCVNTNTLGLFADEAAAMAAAGIIRANPGFCDFPDGFRTRKAAVYVHEGGQLADGTAVYSAFCNDYHVDGDGAEHETVYEGALYTQEAAAFEELEEWRLGGLLDEMPEESCGICCRRIGEAAPIAEGFERYHW